MAQRRGGGGGGFRGGSVGGGFRGGSVGGGFRGGFGGGFRGGFGGFRDGRPVFGYGYGYVLGYPYYGLGYWDSPYYTYNYSPYISTAPGYPVYDYNTSPNVTVIYPAPQQAPAPAYSAPAPPPMRTYDQYGQEVGPPAVSGGSPIYLIATKDQVIRAAASYWVDGDALHYVTLQHEEKQMPLTSVDRALSLQLNRERRVAFQLPQ